METIISEEFQEDDKNLSPDGKFILVDVPDGEEDHLVKQKMNKELKTSSKLEVEKPETKEIEIPVNKFQSTPIIPASVYEKLPDFLKKVTKVFKDPREKDLVLTSALTVLGGCFSNVNGLYNSDTVYPNLFAFVIAPAASGKSRMKYARQLAEGIDNDYSLKPIEEEDEKGKVIKLKRSIFIAGNTTSAAIITSLSLNNGVGIICETEADTLSQSLKSDWGGFSDLLRKAFHAESYSYSRKGTQLKGNGVSIKINEPRLSVALTGTPSQLIPLIRSTEDGLFSRFIYYVYEKPIQFSDVTIESDGPDFKEYFTEISENLADAYSKSKDTRIRFSITETQLKLLNDLLRKHHGKFTTFISNDTQNIIFRMGVICFKIAMILSMVRGFEGTETSDKIVCADEDFENALALVNVYVEHSAVVYNELPKKSNNDLQKQNLKLFENLPSKFRRKDILDLQTKVGISARTLDYYIKDFVDKGLLVKDMHGKYQKAVNS